MPENMMPVEGSSLFLWKSSNSSPELSTKIHKSDLAALLPYSLIIYLSSSNGILEVKWGFNFKPLSSISSNLLLTEWFLLSITPHPPIFLLTKPSMDDWDPEPQSGKLLPYISNHPWSSLCDMKVPFDIFIFRNLSVIPSQTSLMCTMSYRR